MAVPNIENLCSHWLSSEVPQPSLKKEALTFLTTLHVVERTFYEGDLPRRSPNNPVGKFSSLSPFPFPQAFWSMGICLWKVVQEGINNLSDVGGVRLHFKPPESFLPPALLAPVLSSVSLGLNLDCYFCGAIDLEEVIMCFSLNFLICQMGILVVSAWQGYCEV